MTCSIRSEIARRSSGPRPRDSRRRCLQGRVSPVASKRPSFVPELRKCRLHLLIARNFASIKLRNGLVNRAQLILTRVILAFTPCLDLARSVLQFFDVLVRPGG